MVPTDYNEGTVIDDIIKKTIKSMAISTELMNITYKQANE